MGSFDNTVRFRVIRRDSYVSERGPLILESPDSCYICRPVVRHQLEARPISADQALDYEGLDGLRVLVSDCADLRVPREGASGLEDVAVSSRLWHVLCVDVPFAERGWDVWNRRSRYRLQHLSLLAAIARAHEVPDVLAHGRPPESLG